MPTSTGWEPLRRRGPELAVAAVTIMAFFAFLGSMELWGKREQRSAAETIDTVQQGHWLVARIQGRPRLEKPPLPRWTIAGLMELTGRQDEAIVRLPSAVSAAGMVLLVYALGCRLAGRSLGLAAALVLCATPFFIAEMRQAGNDGPLAFFTTLAIYAAYRRLHAAPTTAASEAAPLVPGDRRWLLVMYLALGLGFLTKGPVILMIAGLALVPYLAITRRLGPGLRALVSPMGLLLFLALALSWPVPVMLSDPQAVRVWLLEMGQKAGSAGIPHHRAHAVLATEWFGMTAPWCLLGLVPVAWPLVRRGQGPPPGGWLAWCWTVLNLGIFCFWTVAKPNYFLPCMPGAALLIAGAWLHITAAARAVVPGRSAALSRMALQSHWVVFFVAGVLGPVLVRQFEPSYEAWSLVVAGAVVAGVVASALLWRRGRDVASLGALVGSVAAVVLVAYGAIVPAENAARSHRALARTLDRLLPADTRTVMFFHEIDEGLWFYLKDKQLLPVPGSNPQYNDGYDMLQQYRNNQLVLDPAERLNEYKQKLLHWLAAADRPSPYVLIRGSRFDAIAPDLAGHVEVLYREHDVKRNSLVLLRAVDGGGPLARQSSDSPRR